MKLQLSLPHFTNAYPESNQDIAASYNNSS